MGAKTLYNNDDQEVKDSKKNKRTKRQKPKKHRIRIFPIWLRVIVVLILAAAALALGLMFGYGVMGDGTASDVFKVETWQHIIDIVTKEK